MALRQEREERSHAQCFSFAERRQGRAIDAAPEPHAPSPHAPLTVSPLPHAHPFHRRPPYWPARRGPWWARRPARPVSFVFVCVRRGRAAGGGGAAPSRLLPGAGCPALRLSLSLRTRVGARATWRRSHIAAGCRAPISRPSPFIPPFTSHPFKKTRPPLHAASTTRAFAAAPQTPPPAAGGDPVLDAFKEHQAEIRAMVAGLKVRD